MEAEATPSPNSSLRPLTNEPFPRRLPGLRRERELVEQRQAESVPSSKHLFDRVEAFSARYVETGKTGVYLGVSGR